MNLYFLGHSLALLASTLLPWYWTFHPALSPYTLQLAGSLVILYSVTRFFLRHTNHQKTLDLFTVILINSLIQLLILSTGNVYSPLFFLLPLLLFIVALIFEPFQALSISLITIILFLFQNNFLFSTELITKNLELLLSTPLAIIFGKSYLSSLESKGKIKVLEEKLQQEETDSLLWISTTAKPSITSVFNSISDVIIYMTSSRHNLSLPQSLIEKIRRIQSDLLTLYTSAEDLKDTLESQTDNKNI